MNTIIRHLKTYHAVRGSNSTIHPQGLEREVRIRSIVVGVKDLQLMAT